jgi:hypothetical protein
VGEGVIGAGKRVAEREWEGGSKLSTGIALERERKPSPRLLPFLLPHPAFQPLVSRTHPVFRGEPVNAGKC